MIQKSPEEVKEMLEAWDARQNYMEGVLKENGWTQQEYTWIDPKNGDVFNVEDGYHRLCDRLLTQNGWCCVVETKRLAHSKKEPTQWARYQSPKTKRVYTYLDALSIMENDWIEDDYPTNYCGHSVMLNNLIGPNFQGDEIQTWFGLRGDEPVLELWTGEN
jgi:hypothetical protein